MKNAVFVAGLLALLAVVPRTLADPPIITNIPLTVVGGYKGPNQTTPFVFPDAFNLDLLVTDDQTTASQLMWTYETEGAPLYTINGVPPSDSKTQDMIHPSADRVINTHLGAANGVTEESAAAMGVTTRLPDGKGNTVTIRNCHLAPLGAAPDPNPPAGFTDAQPVTFWCSDGNEASSYTVTFYTDNQINGWNRLSVRPQPSGCGTGYWCVNHNELFMGHSWAISEGPYGDVTTHTWAPSRGICLQVPLKGDNYASIASPMPFFSITANTAYKITLKVNSSQVSPGKTPFWDFIIENSYDPVTKKGLNLFGMDAFFLDNAGGYNSVLQTTDGTELTFYWAPLPVRTSQWNNTARSGGVYSVTYASGKDCRLRFRVMDVDSNAALLNDQKFGSICLQSVRVDPIPLSKLNEVATLVDITTPTRNTALPLGSGNMEAHSYMGASVVFANGTVTLTPAGAGVQNEIVTLTPSSSTDGGYTPTYPFTNMADEWPIPWLSGKLYEMTADLSAPTAYDEAHPFDVMWMGMDTPTNEANCESYMTSNKGIASPRCATPQTYTFLHSTQNETASSHGPLHFLRWRLAFGNSTRVNFPNATDTTNSGAVRVHRVRVAEVTAP